MSAERLPKVVADALKVQVGSIGSDGSADDPAQALGSYDARLRDGVMLQDPDAAPGAPADPGRREFANTGELRDAITRHAPRATVAPRGAISAPSVIVVSWKTADRPLSDAATKLLAEYLRRQSVEHAMRLGLTGTAAADMCMGVQKSRASAIVREMEGAGGATGWLQEKAIGLIRSGKTPRGRDTRPSSHATALFMAMLGSPAKVERWLYDVGYRAKIEPEDLDRSLRRLLDPEREAVEYLIQSRHLWNLYP